MEKNEILALIERSLGLRHKLKVHESLEPPKTHEDLALMLMAKWEIEDEVKAIEDILQKIRDNRSSEKKKIIERDILKIVKKQADKKKITSGKKTR